MLEFRSANRSIDMVSAVREREEGLHAPMLSSMSQRHGHDYPKYTAPEEKQYSKKKSKNIAASHNPGWGGAERVISMHAAHAAGCVGVVQQGGI